ncbi:putative phage abortive infection protein [Pseudomonas fluorescens]|uniref:putative phage abortive infection protein n=1 Tax=Pseudomonas fluorescens TaxID=294 RepID=UPI00125266D3|nr:putative phage abortive infection protein [Pseudomonas fluorescens]VVN32382.1 hypothetical protein PS676_04885 [Pseudomonas fluorescens]
MDDENAVEKGDSNLSGTWLVILALLPIVVISSLVISHFQFGVDIPFLNVINPGSATYWGQIGDFVGGVLNPILSFIALLAVVLSLRSQASELRAARAEARASQIAQTQQTKIFEKQSKLIERQSFETVFFGLLDLHTKNAEAAKFFRNGPAHLGTDAFESYSTKYNVDGMAVTIGSTDIPVADILERANSFNERSREGLGRYFRTLFEFLVYIDNYGVPLRHSPLGVNPILLKGFDTPDSIIKKTYAGIVAATFSVYESECIMLYCLTPEGKGLKSLCEKYGLLKHLPVRQNQEFAKALFEPSAFG